MNKMYCSVSVGNVKFEANHKSELLTQVLFGDRMTFLDKEKNWVKVSIDEEDTIGWILQAQLSILPDEFVAKESNKILFKKKWVNVSDQQALNLVEGTYLDMLDEAIIQEDEVVSIKDVRKSAFKEILTVHHQVPYLWGGMTSTGIDCSGLSKWFYRYLGIRLPQLASAQANYGDFVDFLQHSQCGDLAFFDNELGEINHVGILLNDREIYHASEVNGCVDVDWIDQEGIVNKKTGKRTHKLRMIKRLLDY